MKWLALLLYVALVLRLSNVADLRLLPLTPLLRFPLVEVEEHLEALLWWSCRGRGAACHRDRVSSRTYTLVPTAPVRAGPRSSAPAVIRCGFVRQFVSVRVQRGACCTRLHIHIPMPIPIPMSIHIHTYACARLACISRISGS